MIKRTIIVSCMLIFSITNLVFAAPLDDVITDISNMEAEVQKINYEAGIVESEISNVKEDISKIENEIENNKLEIKKIESDIEVKEKEISNKARSVYMNTVNPNQQYLEILLSAKNIKDFAQRLFTIKEIMSSDKDRLDFFNSSKKEIELRQNKITMQKAELDDKVSSLNSKLDVLAEKRSTKESKILEYQDMKSRYELEIQENEAKIANSVMDIIATVEDEDNSYTNTTPSYNENENNNYTEETNVSASSIVNIAFKYLGVPYVWGGTTPSGFDCSGFVQYVYREAGINISRTTYTQINEGYAVSELAPGDLVFFGSYSAPYHVGIYIGNGQYIHAPIEGDVVKVASLQYRGDYCGARRYL